MAYKKEDDVSLIMSVKLSNGHFESSVEVPLVCTDDEKRAFVDAWLKLMEAGIACGRTQRELKDKQRLALLAAREFIAQEYELSTPGKPLADTAKPIWKTINDAL